MAALQFAPVAQVPSARVWSSFQNDIFAFVEHGQGHAVVQAVAGSGKSTTIIEAFKRVNHLNSVFLAFNKAIVNDLAAKGVNAKTFNSVGHNAVLATGRTFCGDGGYRSKLQQIIKANLSASDAKLYGSVLDKLVNVGKQAGVGTKYGMVNCVSSWITLAEHYDIDCEDGDPRVLYEHAVNLLNASNSSKLFDFGDQLYMPVLFDLALPKYDLLFVDEAQDTNYIQREMLKKMMYEDSRLIAVGDSHQAIYGFRGADSEALFLIKREFGAIELPLTVSYRCATSIIDEARKYVSHITAAPNAPVGEVLTIGTMWKTDDFKANDMVLCRMNRPLITLAFTLLRARVRFYVKGKDVGAGIKSLINSQKAIDVKDLVNKIHVWADKKIAALSDDDKGMAEVILDKRDTVLALTDGCASVSEILLNLDFMFTEQDNAVVLSTIHKAKGLEADTVYILTGKGQFKRKGLLAWQEEQEVNLTYVAITRAKSKLIYIQE